MNWILDVDGVLADFIGHLLSVLGSPLEPSDLTRWDFWDDLGDQKQAALDLSKDPVFWLTLPQVKGAAEGIKAIRAKGYDITFVTSPWLPCKEWHAARLEWLRKNFDIDADDVLVGAKKHMVMADVFTDDRIENVRSWQQAHPDKISVLFKTAQNQSAGPEFVRMDWPEILKTIL